MASDTSFWIKFFTECGIPAGDATSYAIIFTDNRIQKDMLMDLTKEYLKDMGITVLGDVIGILKHAKEVHSQNARDKVLKGSGVVRTSSPVPKRSTAASRTVNHYLGSDPDAAPMSLPIVPKLSKELSARLGEVPQTESPKSNNNVVKINKRTAEEVPVPKSRRVLPEHEGRYKITMPAGTTPKTQKILQQTERRKFNVFDRLGEESGTKASTDTPPSVFNRLGGKTALKRSATSTSIDLDTSSADPPLEYAGILKSSPSPVKKTKITITNNKKYASLGKITISNKTVTSAAGKIQQKTVTTKKLLLAKTRVNSNPTSSSAAMDKAAESMSIRQRLGKKISLPVVSSTTDDMDTPKVKTGITKGRGGQKSEVTSSSGVFSRLGKVV
ncbi:uncharacterized protein C19orf47-like [Ostrea edulis]|uniref:uncharacterized protein C19orf47-like n=1 Tax=Ostrea edulis TaxID=37623 RepID=UPI0024AF7D5F|nr:uncharacterized protein C19orf47-like [Ostrea edulis]